MKFYIYSPQFSKGSGGIVSLHNLKDILIKLNQECEIIYYGEEKNVDTESNSFSIYPEVTIGNPLNAVNVIRWINNTVGVIGGDEDSWGDGDHIYTYSEIFTCKYPEKIIRILSSTYVDWKHIEILKKNKKIYESCFLIRKGVYYFDNFDQHPKDSIEIASWDYYEVTDLISKCKTFYSYDNETFYSLIAPLVGTVSVVIPRDKKTQIDFIGTTPKRKFGVSYGVENIEYSLKTMHLVEDHLKLFEKIDFDSVKNFIADCRHFLKLKDLKSDFNKSKESWEKEKIQLHSEIINIKSSISYKIGRFFTFIPRKVYELK
jgi:hypothetical protein